MTCLPVLRPEKQWQFRAARREKLPDAHRLVGQLSVLGVLNEGVEKELITRVVELPDVVNLSQTLGVSLTVHAACAPPNLQHKRQLA